MANYTEKIGVAQFIIPLVVEGVKTGYHYFDSLNASRTSDAVKNSGLFEMYQNMATSKLPAASTTDTSKLTSYIAIGAAALIGLIAMTR